MTQEKIPRCATFRVLSDEEWAKFKKIVEEQPVGGKMAFDAKTVGLDLVVVATIISVVGVAYNNVALQHTTAMIVWTFSNALFTLFFYGRWKRWWDGGLCDEIMCGLYLFMLVSGLWGLGHV